MARAVRLLPFFRVLSVIVCMMPFVMHSMVYDNRYLPLLRQPFISPPDSTWAFAVRPVFLWSNFAIPSAEVDNMIDDEIPLFQLNGFYNETVLNNALLATNQISQSLFPSYLQNPTPNVPWIPNGKVSFNGCAFETEVRIGNYFAIGGSILFGKLRSFEELTRDYSLFNRSSDGDEYEFAKINKEIHDILGLTPPFYNPAVFGDIDLYLRGGFRGDYVYKMRRFDIGATFGFLIPTGPVAPYNNPAAVPIGGNKHFGIYGALDGRFELKEDITFELLLRLNKRFKKTLCQRMVFDVEPTNYGVLSGPLQVNPGVTFIFSPALQFNCLRRGFGIFGSYTLIKHAEDSFCDKRLDQTYKPNFAVMKSRSSWGSEHVTIEAFYDFGYELDKQSSAPVIGVSVDIPVSALVEQRCGKSHGISLRIESRI